MAKRTIRKPASHPSKAPALEYVLLSIPKEEVLGRASGIRFPAREVYDWFLFLER